MKELPKTRDEQKQAILDLAKLKLTFGREQPVSFFFFKGPTCLVINNEAGFSRNTLLLLAQTVVLWLSPDEYVTVSEAVMTTFPMDEDKTPEEIQKNFDERAKEVQAKLEAGEGTRIECLLFAEATKTSRKLVTYEIKRTGEFVDFVKAIAPTSPEVELRGDFFSLFDYTAEVKDDHDINKVFEPLFEQGILMTFKDYWKRCQDLLKQDKQDVIWN